MSKSLEELQADVTAAQDALKAAEAVRDAARKAEYDARNQSRFAALNALDDSAFYADAPGFDVRPYILPFEGQAKFNPLSDEDRENHDFGPTWTANSTAIICKKDERTRPTRLIWTSGYAGVADGRVSSDAIGRQFEARHDQTGRKLGTYTIVGLAFFGPDGKLARTVGEVPNVKLAQSTYK